MTSLIRVEHLEKRFRVRRRGRGALGLIRGIVPRNQREVVAVRDISFSIQPGEMVAYVGPNGAGKSTTIKMLTGILVPSAGSVTVDGLVPWKQRSRLASRIGVVFGQRTQLWWDLPLVESLRLLRHVYKVPSEKFERRMHRLVDTLDLATFLHRPVRQLSLGQRMRGDLAAALIHGPSILYLDEPTIGLDIVAKDRIRRFLLEINREEGVTVLLTTHDMADVSHLCDRMMIIDHGRLIYDGGVEEITEMHGGERTMVLDLEEDAPTPSLPHARVERHEGRRLWLSFRRDEITAADLIAEVSGKLRVRDLTIQEPDVEQVVRRIYEEGLVEEGAR